MADSGWKQENLRGAILLGSEAIKALLLTNGGGAVGLLTFYGNLVSKAGTSPIFDKAALVVSVSAFGAGLVLAVFCSGFAYISQLLSATTTSAAELPLRIVAIVLAFCSAFAFLGGVVAGVLSLP